MLHRITALIPTMQIHLSDCNRSSNSLHRDLARNKLQLCMLFLANVRDTYWSADVMHRLFDRAQKILSDDSKKSCPPGTRNSHTTALQNNNNAKPVEVFDSDAPSLMSNDLLEANTATAVLEGAHGGTYMSSIDQLLNPEFSLPDDDSTALFPYFPFDENAVDQDQNQLGNRGIQVDLFLNQENHATV